MPLVKNHLILISLKATGEEQRFDEWTGFIQTIKKFVRGKFEATNKKMDEVLKKITKTQQETLKEIKTLKTEITSQQETLEAKITSQHETLKAEIGEIKNLLEKKED